MQRVGIDLKKKSAKIIIIILCVIFAFFCFFRFGLGLGSWRGNSFEDYRDKAYTGGTYSLSQLPKGAQDFRFQCKRYGLGAYSFAAFTLGKDDYDDFVTAVSEMKKPSDLDGLGFTGKKVSETMDVYDNYGSYIGFPKGNCDYIIDDDIKEYTILYYDSYHGAGSKINAIAVNPATGRVVVVNGGTN